MVARPGRTYRGAMLVSVVFKVVSVIILVVGFLASVSIRSTLTGDAGTSRGDADVLTLALIAGTVVGAAAVAFFAYVLDLLLGVESNTAPMRPLPLTQPPGPGWYPEPGGGGGQRYWTGSSWAVTDPPAAHKTHG